jgi:hypothetical protein
MGTVQEWITLIQTGGAIAFLALAVWLGIKAKVIPEKTHNDMLVQQKKLFEETTSRITDGITDGMKLAVREGIREGLSEGYLKMKEINGGAKRRARRGA